MMQEDNLEISEKYDREDDIYYVTMKTGEPSHVREHHDDLLIEIGFFTGLPTEFRILNYSKNRKNADKFKLAFKEVCKEFGLRKMEKSLAARNRQFDKFFESALA